MHVHQKAKKRVLIFLDIDGTLITPRQRPNTKALPRLIRRLAKRGVLFGFNSNRSYEDLAPLYRKFALNGPLVIENGVYFRPTLRGKIHYLIPRPPQNVRAITRRTLTEFIKRECLRIKSYIGDSTRFIISKKVHRVPLAIVANGYRRHTGSIHLLRYGKRDAILAARLERFLQKFFLHNRLGFQTNLTRAFSNVTFHPKEAGKRKALKRLKRYYPHYDFYIIGDDLGDLEASRGTCALFAVGNAQPEVKRQAAYVASRSYTAGVVEILKYFERTLLQ